MFEEARPVENTNYDRKVRENQRNEFKKILEED
jgi:PAX-interacting protein 1